jgi:hypothetical protein
MSIPSMSVLLPGVEENSEIFVFAMITPSTLSAAASGKAY